MRCLNFSDRNALGGHEAIESVFPPQEAQLSLQSPLTGLAAGERTLRGDPRPSSRIDAVASSWDGAFRNAVCRRSCRVGIQAMHFPDWNG